MTQPNEDPAVMELVAAAANADAVRLAALVVQALAVTGEGTVFDRASLTAAWSGRWPRHLAQPGNRQPVMRVKRSVPVLVGCGALTDVNGTYLPGSLPVVDFLANRLYLAEDLDRLNPFSNELTVDEGTFTAAFAVLYPPPPADPVTVVEAGPAMAATTLSPLSSTADASRADNGG